MKGVGDGAITGAGAKGVQDGAAKGAGVLGVGGGVTTGAGVVEAGATEPVSIITPAKSGSPLVVAVSRNSPSVYPTRNAAPSGLTATFSNTSFSSVPDWRRKRYA